MSDSNKEAQLGPYKNSNTTRITLSPIVVTIEKVDESTHVPPADNDCGCGGGAVDYSVLSDTLMKMGAAIMDQLGKIRRNQAAAGPVADAGFDEPSIPYGSAVKDGQGNPL